MTQDADDPRRRYSPPTEFLHRLLKADRGELSAVVAGFGVFFCLFSGYSMLRPLRETMGITGGVQNLQWLFTATFLTMLLAVPAYGALTAAVPRARLIPWVYAFFIANLLAFTAGFRAHPESVWLARVFYVWLSVFNLCVISVAWSLMADVFRPAQARRLFALIAAGASAGGLLGPMLAGLLVGIIGHAGLGLLAAGLLGLCLLGVGVLLRWRARAGAGMGLGTEDPERPIGGGIFAGLSHIARSPYLLGISAFVVLLATASTFLYFEQARLVAEIFPDRMRQTQVFSALDAVVQALTIFTQIFLTGRLAARRGVTVLLTAVPVVITGGLLFLAFMPVFGVLAAVMVLRRVGEYALVRPGREMLFTLVDAETKYKAKNVIDTVVYRGGDAVSGWVKAGIDGLGFGAWLVALVGGALAAVWAGVGYWLGRSHDAKQQGGFCTPV